MKRSRFGVSVALSIASELAACNSAAPPIQSPSTTAPLEQNLPQGSGCSGAIARYRAIQENDLAMGHVNPSVYNEIKSEIAAAETACASGNEAKANSLIRASKARHGYPA